MTRRQTIALIGCSAKKHPAPADQLLTPSQMYAGDLFRYRLRYAELRQLTWGVLSAAYGLWWPHELRKSYDMTLDRLQRLDAIAWPIAVTQKLLDYLDDEDDPRKIHIEIHAGADYAYPLSQHLELCGFTVTRPCEHMGIGKQKQLYVNGSLSPRALQMEKPVRHGPRQIA